MNTVRVQSGWLQELERLAEEVRDQIERGGVCPWCGGHDGEHHDCLLDDLLEQVEA